MTGYGGGCHYVSGLCTFLHGQQWAPHRRLERNDPETALSKGSFGIDVVWLTPVYKRPLKDMGNNISVYERTYPLYGTIED